jgi:hypothetical protein
MENQEFKKGDKIQFTSWVGKKVLEGVFIKLHTGPDKKEYAMINVDGKNYLKLLKSVQHAS